MASNALKFQNEGVFPILVRNNYLCEIFNLKLNVFLVCAVLCYQNGSAKRRDL